jgi:hypothetical protein
VNIIKIVPVMLEKSVWKEAMRVSLNRQNVRHLLHAVNKMLRKRGALKSFPFLTLCKVDDNMVQRYNCIIYGENEELT